MIIRAAAIAICCAAGLASASAEPLFPWDEEPFWERQQRTAPGRSYEPPMTSRQPQQGGDVRDGGGRPEIAPKAPIVVAFDQPEYAAGSIVIDSGARKLYFVLPGGRAFQYPISVGREGFAWAGTEKISRKQAWPDWHPPAEMRKRDPKLPVKMMGGVKNPLGAMALYLGNTLYRIHGTNDERTIGHASSSGCFRMMNSAVLHLSQFAQVGTPVTVVNRLPNQPAPPPVASTRTPVRPPPVAVDEPQRLPPPAPVARDTYDDEQMDDRYDTPARRPSRADDDADVADVRVTPRRSVDDYDPYARQPYPRPRYDRFGDRYRDRPDSYASSRGSEDGGRVWYDDERDDF